VSPNRRGNSSKSIKLFSVVLSAFFVLILARMIIGSIAGGVSTQSRILMIQMGSIQSIVTSRGVIIRDEELVQAPFSGEYVIDVSDGEKVVKGQKIATVFREGSNQILVKLNSIDTEIMNIQQNKKDNVQMFSADLKRVDHEINQNIKKIIRQSNSSNIAEISALKHDIDSLMQKRVTIVGGFNTSDTYLNGLKARKSSVQAEINANTNEVKAEHAGIISFNIDGYEKALVPEGVNKLTSNDLEKVKPRNIKMSVDKTVVDAEMRMAKIIKGIDYYIAICVNDKQAASLQEGGVVKLRIRDIDKVIEGIIAYKSKVQEKINVIVVKTDEMMQEMVNRRIVDIDLITNSYKGLKVPLTSLVNFDKGQMTAKLILVKYGSDKSVKVRVLGVDQEFAIIENIDKDEKEGVNLYDTFIANPR